MSTHKLNCEVQGLSTLYNMYVLKLFSWKCSTDKIHYTGSITLSKLSSTIPSIQRYFNRKNRSKCLILLHFFLSFMCNSLSDRITCKFNTPNIKPYLWKCSLISFIHLSFSHSISLIMLLSWHSD